MKRDYRIIYEPKGPAREYSPLACNIYKGCEHGCRYCFGKNRKSPEQKKQYDSDPNPKDHFIEKLEYKANKLRGNRKEILLSFLGDVYQPAETKLKLTRNAIKILIENDLPFIILTKGGTRAIRDFDLLQGYDKTSFGTTLIFLDQEYADYWEPGAPSISDRIEAIQEAKSRGIKTWISLEPVIDPKQALEVIEELNPIVDHWKVGKINYHKEVERRVNWITFREQATSLLQDIGANFYIKKSLSEL